MGRLELGLRLEVVEFSFKAVSPPRETTNGKGYKIQEAF
jgi:hypothetical protein